METFWFILKFIIANILLFIISATLIGSCVRGYLQPRTYTNIGNHKSFFYKISTTTGFIYSTIATVITIIILYLIIIHINIYVFLGVLFSMISRIKDLLSEIRTGLKTSKNNMTKKPIDLFLNIVFLIGFCFFNYGVYNFLLK